MIYIEKHDVYNGGYMPLTEYKSLSYLPRVGDLVVVNNFSYVVDCVKHDLYNDDVILFVKEV